MKYIRIGNKEIPSDAAEKVLRDFLAQGNHDGIHIRDVEIQKKDQIQDPKDDQHMGEFAGIKNSKPKHKWERKKYKKRKIKALIPCKFFHCPHKGVVCRNGDACKFPHIQEWQGKRLPKLDLKEFRTQKKHELLQKKYPHLVISKGFNIESSKIQLEAKDEMIRLIRQQDNQIVSMQAAIANLSSTVNALIQLLKQNNVGNQRQSETLFFSQQTNQQQLDAMGHMSSKTFEFGINPQQKGWQPKKREDQEMKKNAQGSRSGKSLDRKSSRNTNLFGEDKSSYDPSFYDY